MRAYKIQLVQELKPHDHRARRTFGEWAENKIAADPNFHKKILFTHFGLNSNVNKQNCRILTEDNLQPIVQTPLHPEKLTVWCALWFGGIIGPYFFKNDAGQNVTVNSDRYRDMIKDFFVHELHHMNVL